MDERRAERQETPDERVGGRRRRLALVVSVVVGLGLLTAAALLIGRSVMASMNVEDSVRDAEGHYDAAVRHIEIVDGLFSGMSAVSAQAAATPMATAATSATAALERADDELRAAAETVRPLEESEGREKYLRSVKEARAGVRSLLDTMAYVERLAGLLERVSAGLEATREAREGLNEGVRLANAKKWDDAKKRAQASRESFERARKVFDEAHALDSSADLDQASAYLDKESEEARLMAQIAELGKAGKIDEYNERIGKMEKLRKELLGMNEPLILTQPTWAQERVADRLAEADERFERADELRLRALERFFVAD